MRKKSVIYKLLITFSSIMSVFLILMGMFFSTWINKEYNINKNKQINKYIEIIEEATTKFLKKNNNVAFEDLKNVMKLIEESFNMDSIIVDSEGYVYAVSDDNLGYLKYNKIDISSSDIDLLKSGEDIKSDFNINSNKNCRAYYKPVFIDNTFKGIIILIEDIKRSSTYDLYTIIWLVVLMAALLSSMVAYYLAQKILIKPLSEINNAAKKFAKGEVEKRVYIDSEDEIGELAESFNIMAESLEKVDAVRREFISNVSHELRSPITSIKGFVTGIIDGVIPKDKESYYLNIVNDEIGRLSRLVTDLLDISSMESGKFKLNIVRIDINEIISLCILNLEGKMKKRKIKVEIIFNNKYEYCYGDKDRITQVLINLIENAIKYGYEGGRIKVETYAKGDLVYVSIFNSGPTIPKEDINKIWERFYKMDKSRTNKVSMGLGLPIVRLILTQHNQDIWFNNIPNKGIEFTFTLKRE